MSSNTEQIAYAAMKCLCSPLEKVKPWQTNGVKGVYSFLAKAFRFFGDSSNWVEGEEDTEVLKISPPNNSKSGK